MTHETKSLPTWILVISSLFAALEIIVSCSLYFSPQSSLEMVDLKAKGVEYLTYMWASRQFALGFIFAFATFKKSVPMLTLAYIFFLVMFIWDTLIGISQHENSLIIAGLVMCVISSTMIYFVNKSK